MGRWTVAFWPFCWFGYYHSSEGFGRIACIGEGRQTKNLVRENDMVSVNLVFEQLLLLVDYYSCTYSRVMAY